jgi:hypothetical protein
MCSRRKDTKNFDLDSDKVVSNFSIGCKTVLLPCHHSSQCCGHGCVLNGTLCTAGIASIYSRYRKTGTENN